MNRRTFLALPVWHALAQPSNPEPVPEPHFPNRLYQFVWRNWELANTDRIAAVLRTSADNVLRLGASMGLPAKHALSADLLSRIYITTIRQNWHILPEEQLVELLGWDAERFRFTLKEDDFLDVKLGRKPACPPLKYEAPSKEELARATEIRATVSEIFGDAFQKTGEPACRFIARLSDTHYPTARHPRARLRSGEVDLSRGWHIAVAPGLEDGATRLQSWLREAMSSELKIGAGTPAVRLLIDPSLSGSAGSFRVSVAGREVTIAGRDRFGVTQGIYFVEDRMERRGAPFLHTGEIVRRSVWDPRYLYSYFALYGDPLLEPERDPFPDGYLEKLARRGINGVWMQAVLNTLAPSRRFPEFGRGCEKRLDTLAKLVDRAGRFGVRVLLYLNEPRAMPASFFDAHPALRGSHFNGLYSMCTSTPEVRDWIADSVEHVVRAVPAIGGFFTITMSENHTNCFSHGGAWGKGAPNAGDCPRCSRRSSWETIAEFMKTVRDGVRRRSASAEVITWDWGWGDALAENLIPLLPKDVRVLSVSEWDAPVRRGGVETSVGEYSISVVGPGPRATRNWQRARSAGVAPMAKVQWNNTWEISAVPYIPVPHLIAEHCEGLARSGVAGIQASWTCGGFPSPNLEVARSWFFEPRLSRNEVLLDVATGRYGEEAAADAVEAWRRFSDAFREFPYGVAVYTMPTQHGPANLLRLKSTGHRAGMILFPHDYWRGWCGRYPPAVAQQQFAKLAAGWKAGLAAFDAALAKAQPHKHEAVELDRAVAATCLHHFQSVANQLEFYMLRDSTPQTADSRARMRAIVADELELARRQYRVAKARSEIAYEATNHYYYRPLDLVEKVLSCRQLLAELA